MFGQLVWVGACKQNKYILRAIEISMGVMSGCERFLVKKKQQRTMLLFSMISRAARSKSHKVLPWQ